MERRPNRYELPIASIVGAMLVVLLVVLGFVAVRGILRDNEAVPVPTVDYAHVLAQGKADGKLSMLSPKPMPAGWRATSARYRGGADAHWHLGVLTSGEKYVGLEQAKGSVGDLLASAVKGDAVEGEPIRIAGRQWQQWQVHKGDYVLTRTDGDVAVLLRGSAPAIEIQAYAARLAPA